MVVGIYLLMMKSRGNENYIWKIKSVFFSLLFVSVPEMPSGGIKPKDQEFFATLENVTDKTSYF